jgi:CheY-like chemotaxis protein
MPLSIKSGLVGKKRENVRMSDPLRILVVDDNKDAAETLGMMLMSQRHVVEVYLDPREALVAAEKFQPTHGLLDINMPGLNGYELAQAIRQIDGCGDIQLIAVTGYGRAEDRARSREAGFNHHLVKPAAFQEVVDLLGDCRQA